MAKARILLALLYLAFAAGIFVPHGVAAAVSFVQSKSGACSSACTSTSVAFTSGNTAGNLIVVGAGWDSSAPTAAISDTQGNLYATAVPIVSTVGGVSSQIWYAKNIKGGADTVTVTYNGTPSLAQVAIHEYSGLDTVAPLDVTASSQDAFGSSVSSGPAVTHFANELIFGFGSTGGTLSAGSGYTQRAAVGAGPYGLSEDKIVSAAGSYFTTFGLSGSVHWTAMMATFQAPPGTQVSSRSDILSYSQPSATSNHTIAFTTNNSLVTASTNASSTLTVGFPPDFNLSNIFCKDVDISFGGTATSIAGNFANRSTNKNCPGTATTWGLFIDTSANALTFYTPTAAATYVATGTQVLIQIGTNASFQDAGTTWITNPSAAGIYTISVGGTFGGSGNMLVSINSGVSVQVSIPESLAFTVSSVAAVNCTADDGATITAIGTSPTSVPFGTVSLNTFYIGCQDLVVSTNAGGGYSVTMQESSAMKTADGRFSIPDTTCDNGNCTVVTATTWVTPTKNGFGHTCFNQVGNDCHSSYANGTKFKPVSNTAAGTNNATITFVQQATGLVNPGTSFTITLNVAPHPGDALVFQGASQGSHPTSISGGGVTWIQTARKCTNRCSDIWYGLNSDGSSATITVSFGSSQEAGGNVSEWSGIAKTGALDVSSGFDTCCSGSDNAPTTQTATTTNPTDLLIGEASIDGSWTITGGPTNSFTALTEANTGANAHTVPSYRIVTATSTYSTSWTTSGSNGWDTSIAAFAAVSGVGQTLMSSSTPATATGRVK